MNTKTHNANYLFVYDKLCNANNPQEIFGQTTNPKTARHTYLKLARIVHPDTGGTGEAFLLLQNWWEAFESGKTGRMNINISSHPDTHHRHQVKSPTGKTYTINNVAEEQAGGFRLLHVDDSSSDRLILASVDMSNRDLGLAMQHSLESLGRETSVGDYSPFAGFYPRLREGFVFREEGRGEGRFGVVYERHEGLVSLRKVREAFPNGVDAKDAAWMFRQLLVAVAVAQDSLGLVHGGITPDTVFIHPEQHGVVLEGWGASVQAGCKVPVVDPRWRFLYPSVVLNGGESSFWVDVSMAAALFEWLVDSTSGGSYAGELKAFVEGVRKARGVSRRRFAVAGSAWVVRDEFGVLIEELWGRRVWRDFVVPEMKST